MWEVCGLVVGIRKNHTGQCKTREGTKTQDVGKLGMESEDKKNEEGHPESPQSNIMSFTILPSGCFIYCHLCSNK